MADFALLAFAFGVGFVAFANPCGLAVLMAYVTNFFSQKTKHATAIGKLAYGASAGMLATFGFITLFAIAGILIGFVSRSIADWIPYVNVALGVGLIGYAYHLHRGGSLNVHFRVKPTRLDRPLSFYNFGIVYALASFGCTLPLFMTVVVATLGTGDLAAGLQTFAAYSLGMGLAMTMVTVALATSQSWISSIIDNLQPKMHRLNIEVMALVGAYLIIRNILILANIPIPTLFQLSL